MLRATITRIWNPPRRLWCHLNIPPYTVYRKRAVWWNGGARRQSAHHKHSAVPPVAFQMELVRKSVSGSRSIWRGLTDMILPGREDPKNPKNSEWDQKLGKIECVIHCMIRWCKMRWVAIYPWVSRIYTLHCSVHHCYPCLSVRPNRPFHLRHPCISVYPA